MIELTQTDIAKVDGAAACQEACGAPYSPEVEPLRVYEFPLLPCGDGFAPSNAQ